VIRKTCAFCFECNVKSTFIDDDVFVCKQCKTLFQFKNKTLQTVEIKYNIYRIYIYYDLNCTYVRANKTDSTYYNFIINLNKYNIGTKLKTILTFQ
jgi:hypothetical protein